MRDAGALQHRNHTLAVGAVGQDEDFTCWRHSGGKHGLDAEGSAACSRMASKPASRERPASRRILSRTLATTALNSKMPGTGVAQHGLLHR